MVLGNAGWCVFTDCRFDEICLLTSSNVRDYYRCSYIQTITDDYVDGIFCTFLPNPYIYDGIYINSKLEINMYTGTLRINITPLWFNLKE